MKLFLDNEINNTKILETNFSDLNRRIEIKRKEIDELQSEGEEILGKRAHKEENSYKMRGQR